MQLTELLLNRQLMKEAQDTSTQGSPEMSSNLAFPSQYIAYGGNAAIDVNQNTPTILGDKIKTGAIESTNYSYTSPNTYSNAGTSFDLNNGAIISKQFAIDSSGNASFGGTIVGGALDIPNATSATSWHVDSSGNMWSGANVANKATAPFRVSNAGAIVASNLSLTLGTSSFIEGGQSAYDTGTGFFIGYSSGYKFSVGNSSGNKLTWDGTSLSVVGSISSSVSGQRVVISGTLAQFFNSSNVEIADTYASSNSYWIKGMQTNSNILLDTGSTGVISFINNGNQKMIFDGGAGGGTYAVLAPYTGINVDLGSGSFNFRDYYMNGSLIRNGVNQPEMSHGLASGTSITKDNGLGWTLTNPSTGHYTVTHNLGTTDYTIQLTAKRASGTGAYIAKVDSQSSNSFNAIVFDETGASQDGDFYFLVLLNI